MSALLMVQAMSTKVGNPLRKLILIKLADNANDKGECWPSYQHIADQCETSRRSVISHIGELEKQGLLSIQHRKTDKGNSSNVFQLHLGGSEKIAPPVVKRASDGEVAAPTSANDALPSEIDSLPPGEAAAPRTCNSSEPVREPNKNTKAEMLESRFESFYSKYPIKKSKAQARKVFAKLNPDDLLLQKIIRALRAQIENRDHAIAAGVWVPEWKHPSTWLNGQCWEDSLIEIPAHSSAQPHMGGRNHGATSTHRSASSAGAKLSTVDRQHAAASAYLAGLQRQRPSENLDDSVVASYE